MVNIVPMNSEHPVYPGAYESICVGGRAQNPFFEKNIDTFL